MAEAVYSLCALMSLSCALQLARSYARSRVRLLKWASLGFAGLALNNILLFTDLVLLPNIDLSVERTTPAFVGMLILVYGLVWDTA